MPPRGTCEHSTPACDTRSVSHASTARFFQHKQSWKNTGLDLASLLKSKSVFIHSCSALTMFAVAVAVVTAVAARGPPWKVLPDTDWPNNAPGGNTCEVKATNASTCADACFGMRNCVSACKHHAGTIHSPQTHAPCDVPLPHGLLPCLQIHLVPTIKKPPPAVGHLGVQPHPGW